MLEECRAAKHLSRVTARTAAARTDRDPAPRASSEAPGQSLAPAQAWCRALRAALRVWADRVSYLAPGWTHALLSTEWRVVVPTLRSYTRPQMVGSGLPLVWLPIGAVCDHCRTGKKANREEEQGEFPGEVRAARSQRQAEQKQ
jgi:hypothetical protein